MSSNTNIVIVEGRIEGEILREGKEISFSLKNNRYFFKNRSLVSEVQNFKIKVSGVLADRVTTFCKNGNLLLVSGHLLSTEKEIAIQAHNVKWLSRGDKK